MRHTPIPITAFALTNALGSTTTEVLAALFAGETGLTACRWPLPFETFAGEAKGELAPLTTPEERAFDSRAARLLARALDELESPIAQARCRWGAARIGLVLGTSTGGIAETERAFDAFRATGAIPADFDFERQHAFGGLVEFARQRTGIDGPAFALSTACSSSGKVFGSAQRLIESGLCDAVLIGGADSLCQTTLRGFGSLEVVSRMRCRPFCADREGLNIGEGAALLLLEREGLARAHLLGVGESSDAYHMSHPHPDGFGALAAMRGALAQAGRTPEEVDHINAHGTGTQANDLIEGRAIAALFGAKIPVVSTKAYTGHLLGAGGATEAIFACASLEAGRLPRALDTQPLDPALDIFLPERALDCPLKNVLSNSFAFGGSNVSVLLGK
ncbi:MAG: beta-ketoacyl-ACP synthase [Myxococcales bacterium]|nr:beta-ketoacyl-ACP synthase [Myxococcales bacterium]